MKFIYADSMDMIDPRYDFAKDENGPGRRTYWDDAYPHEFMDAPPYHGMLVSRAIVGDARIKGKYSDSQSMRFRRVGARAFLRLDRDPFRDFPIYGDCGAFSYVNEERPPYEVEDVAAFYDECDFDFGCSLDHIIFDFDVAGAFDAPPSEKAKDRFDLTLENAATFIDVVRRQSLRVHPIGVVQGWSPASMAHAAQRLVAMGYDYIALGGMAPLKSPAIHAALTAVRDAIPRSVRIHVLGFTKVDDIGDFACHDIFSVDSTSPLLRAFKDARNNLYALQPDGSVRYFTALRIPQAIENSKLQRLVKQGELSAEELSRLERRALEAVRAYDRDEAPMEETLAALLDYASLIEAGRVSRDQVVSLPLARLETAYRETLTHRPWRTCGCSICRTAGVEMAIFRASNRNKRRGIHNLQVVKTVIDRLSKPETAHAVV